MNLSFDAIMIIAIGAIILIIGLILLLLKNKMDNKNKKPSVNNTSKTNVRHTKEATESNYKKNPNANIAKEDVFNFMEFDKIQDNMIIQQKGEKYTAVIKCKGINYNLMSEVEQLSVEEGFMTFLNTLKFPVQLYVQAQTVNLKSNITSYKENMKSMYEEYDDINTEYNTILNSLESTDEEIEEVEEKRNSILNVLEYGQDIVRYVEKLALNKNMLQRSFYVLVSYYKSELSNASNFNKEELLDICYSELFTRVQNIMSGLSMCSVNATILSSNEIAELLYSAYNRDDKNFMSVQQALEAGFYRLYSTSEDAITKKHKKLVESIRQEAEYKAIAALNKAMEEGTYATQADVEDAFDQESSKQAIEIVKKEKVSDKVKQDAKKIIVEEYKKAKKERLEKEEERLDSMREKIAKIKGESVEEDMVDEVAQDQDTQQAQAEIVVEENTMSEENNSTEDDNESIV